MHLIKTLKIKKNTNYYNFNFYYYKKIENDAQLNSFSIDIDEEL